MSLRKCDHSIRIPIMATLRNRALMPLSKWKEEMKEKTTKENQENQEEEKEEKRKTKRRRKKKKKKNSDTAILFINDVLATAEDMFTLMNGKENYDMMCGVVSSMKYLLQKNFNFTISLGVKNNFIRR